jgi:hypothetical protein
MLLAREARLGWLPTGEAPTREAQRSFGSRSPALAGDGDERGVSCPPFLVGRLLAQGFDRFTTRLMKALGQGQWYVKYSPFFCEKCHSVETNLRVP